MDESLPSDGTLYSLPVRQGDFVKAGDLLAEMADLHKVRVTRILWTNRKSVRFGPNEPVASHGTRSRSHLEGRNGKRSNKSFPRARSVGELLCSETTITRLLPNVNVSVRINSQSVPMFSDTARYGRF